MTFSAIQQRVQDDISIGNRHPDEGARRNRLLAFTVQECAEVGYRNARMSSVAKRASVSTATLYRVYKDKTDLLYQCVAYLVPMLADALTIVDTNENPYTRIETMLIKHGEAMGDPYLSWLYRIYVSAGVQEGSAQLVFLTRAGRMVTEAHWKIQLSLLVEQNYLRPAPLDVTINLLLGQIERRTILAQLLFGNDDQAEPSLEAAARFAAGNLFANLGTAALHKAFPKLPDG